MGMIAISTWVAFRLHFNLSAVTSFHLFVVVLIALQWGFLEATITSLISVTCLDYFFTQPLFVLYMSDPRDWFALAVFVSVALLVSRLSMNLKKHASEVDIQRSRLQKLYDLSQSVLLLDRHQPAEPQLVNLIRTMLGVEGVALWDAYEVHLYESGNCNVTELEVRSTYFTEKEEDEPERGVSKRVLRIGARPIGSLIFCGHSLDTMSINAAASLTANAIERARSFSAETNAEAARQSEQLRSTVLDALAHAYKTPLTTIKSSSSGLLEIGTLSDFQRELVSLIDEQAEHLHELTDRLLRTADLDRNSLKLNRKEVDLFELASDIARQHKRDIDNHPIQVHTASPHVLVFADAHLLRMAVEQLLDNAIKYASPHSEISISIREDGAEGTVGVHNQGSFIAPEERQRIFHRFHRGLGAEHRAAGTGIGLSVAKRITVAHRGRIWVDSDPEAGTVFFMALPKMAKEK